VLAERGDLDLLADLPTEQVLEHHPAELEHAWRRLPDDRPVRVGEREDLLVHPLRPL
jgi:hypothetical protein